MADLPSPTLQLRLDREALAHNWCALDRLSGDAAAGAAVKADAYGLGIENVVPVLTAAGCRNFFVAHWSEVPALLDHIPPAQISVLHGPVKADDVAFAISAGVRPVLNSMAQVQRWIGAGGGACDVMVDTGINRLGLSMDSISDPLLASLQIDTLMSHLASADEDSPLNALQRDRFLAATAAIPANRTSLANSAGIALGSDYAFDLTRPGLALYGGIPRAELAADIRQVAFPQAAILQTRDLAVGDSVGYNATFTADRPMRVGVVSLGYADGYLRSWSHKGSLLHGDQILPLLGKVSMDMVVADLTNAPDLQEADWLDVPYSLPEASQTSGLSQYELLTTLGRRYRR